MTLLDRVCRWWLSRRGWVVERKVFEVEWSPPISPFWVNRVYGSGGQPRQYPVMKGSAPGLPGDVYTLNADGTVEKAQ